MAKDSGTYLPWVGQLSFYWPLPWSHWPRGKASRVAHDSGVFSHGKGWLLFFVWGELSLAVPRLTRWECRQPVYEEGGRGKGTAASNLPLVSSPLAPSQPGPLCGLVLAGGFGPLSLHGAKERMENKG